MRVHFFLLLSIVFISSSTHAQYPQSLHLEELRIWIKDNTYDNEFSNLGYDEARRQMYSFTDEVGGKIQCIYTDFEQNAEYTTFPDPINAEHLVPQSFFNSQEPMRADLHALRPSHMSANSARANFPIGEVPDADAKWHGIDGSGMYFSTFTEPSDNSDFSEGIVGLFEPQEDRKGDVARQLLYFYTMYPTVAGPMSDVADILELYDWHLNDPVDVLEELRNDRVEIVQGNRNPYIDHVSLAYDAWFWEEDNCSVFETPPVELTKSFQPVPYPDGVIDRVQVKWYKQSPKIKYAPEDNAACDIKFWPVRDLILDIPIIDGDTSIIPERTKPGQEFFKWPIKFQRSDVDPNIRYNWRVRCACEEGAGLMSPWSATKIFNTPDFDPNTNIYTPPENVDSISGNSLKSRDTNILRLYPNPVHKELNLRHLVMGLEWSIVDMTGRILMNGRTSSELSTIDIEAISPGNYIFQIKDSGETKLLTVY